MRCPKCHYISFDYNQVCPKCNKDISVEQEKLNIPAFKPDPPSLLGALLGDAQPVVHLSESPESEPSDQEHMNSIDDGSPDRSAGIELDDSQEIDLGLDLNEDKEGLELGGILEEPGSGVDSGALGGDGSEAEKPSQPGDTDLAGSITMKEAEVFPKAEKDGEEISLKLEEITLEDIAPDGKATEPKKTLEPELGDSSPSDPSLSDTNELLLDLDLMPDKQEKVPSAKEQDEITLSLDDLKVNETGELEIGRNISAIARAKESAQEASGMEVKSETPIAEAKEAEEDLSLLLGEDSIEISADPAEDVQTLDLENLDLELDLDGSERK